MALAWACKTSNEKGLTGPNLRLGALGESRDGARAEKTCGGGEEYIERSAIEELGHLSPCRGALAFSAGSAHARSPRA